MIGVFRDLVFFLGEFRRQQLGAEKEGFDMMKTVTNQAGPMEHVSPVGGRHGNWQPRPRFSIMQKQLRSAGIGETPLRERAVEQPWFGQLETFKI